MTESYQPDQQHTSEDQTRLTETDGASQYREVGAVKRHKVLAGALVLGACAAAGFVGYGYSRYQEHQSTLQTLQNKETNDIKTMQANGLLESTRIFKLGSGVMLRTTPGMINDSYHGLLKGNGYKTIPDDKEVIVSQPIWKVDDNGVWMGLTFDKAPIATTKRNPAAIAHDYVWVNYSQLYKQKNAQGKPYIESYDSTVAYPALVGKAAMNGQGAVTLNGKANAYYQGAYAIEESAGTAAELLPLFGVAPKAEQNQPAH